MDLLNPSFLQLYLSSSDQLVTCHQSYNKLDHTCNRDYITGAGYHIFHIQVYQSFLGWYVSV